MDLQKIRSLAGLPSVRQTTTKQTHDPVLEAGDAKFIVSSLRTKFAEYANVNVKVHDSIKEYLQANADAPNADALKEALALVAPKASFEQTNSLRKMAGLPPLTEKKDEEEEEEEEEEVIPDEEEEAGEEEEKEEADTEDSEKESDEPKEKDEKEKKDDSEENDIPSIVAKIANKLLKDGIPEEDKLADFLLKVYNAGLADGASQAS